MSNEETAASTMEDLIATRLTTRDVELSGVFGAGSPGGEERATWTRQQVDFCSADEDGVLVTNDDELENLWGDGDQGSVEHTGNGG
jgi:hypothetical protein